jgi:transcriptional regulator with XRE-family HTH domain
MINALPGQYRSDSRPLSHQLKQVNRERDSLSRRIYAVAERLAKQLGSFLRKKRGDLTYAQFAKKIGLSDSTLHRLEMGQQNVTLRTLEHLAGRLKCRVGEMLGEG